MAGLRLFILGTAAVFISAGSAVAQQQYRTWDRNNDGVVTRAEWRGTVQEFRDRDWNRDGVLSGTELADDDWTQAQAPTGQTFVSLDRNRDGRLTRGEWRGDRGTFLRADRNGDNFISRSEFINFDVASVDNDVLDFDALDDDRSNRIERAEWSGTRAAFNRLDTNRDGVLSRRELLSNDAVVARADGFDAADYNNNGVISRGEWQDGALTFNRYDVNRDGVISRREYAARGDDVGVERTFSVNPRQQWTDTGVFVNAGDVITWRAEGTIVMMTGNDDRATPAGSVSGRTASDSPRPDQKAGTLLLRIGNGSVEAVGAQGTFTARNSGPIYLGVNDDYLDDNSGEYRVAVSVSPR